MTDTNAPSGALSGLQKPTPVLSPMNERVIAHCARAKFMVCWGNGPPASRTWSR